MKKRPLIITMFFAGLLVLNCSQLADNPVTTATVKCEVCHQVPPADSMHRPGSNTDHCNQCHAGYTITGNTIKLDSTHNNGKIDYRCNICHGFPVADSMWYHQGSSLTNINCDSCHSGVAVKNGIIEALPSTHENSNGIVAVKCNSCHAFPPGGLAHSNSSATRINCDSCHTGVVVTNGNISIQPGHETAPIKCTVCHSVPPNDSLHDTTEKYNCDSCHSGITIVKKMYSLDSSTHDNGIVNAKCNVCHGFPPSGNSHKNSGPSHVNCDSCHSGVVVTAGVPVVGPSHGTAPIKCVVCHGVPPDTTPHIATQKFNCDSCHTGISISNDSYLLDSLTHNNGTINLKCNGCHAFPPTLKPHPVHVTVKKYDCTVCHSGYNGATVPPTPPPYHRGDTVVKFSSAYSLNVTGAGYDTVSKSCSNVYCHGNFPDGTDRTVKVTDTNSIGCGFCHDTASMFAQGHPRTDTLVWHRHTNAGTIRSCGYCHAGYSITAPVSVVDSIHVNGVINVMVLNGSGTIVTVKPDSTGHVDITVCSPCH